MEKEITQKQLIIEVFKPLKIERTGKDNKKYYTTFKTWEERKEFNKKKYRDEKIKEIRNHMKNTLINLNKSIDKYKELYHKTELWENGSTIDFNMEDWNTMRKTNGRLTRYYNDICKIYSKLDIN